MAYAAVALAVGLVVMVLAQRVWQRFREAQLQAKRELAMLEFVEVRAKLQMEFLVAAGATGKPRGLSWKQCDLDDGQLFATDRVNGELFALVGATISFEAIPGGGMEDVEAVGNLRYATAFFVHRSNAWTTDGRAAFNLEPPQALEHYVKSLLPLR